MMNCLTNECFKKLTIIFWMLWWLAAFWTDLSGGLAHLGVIQTTTWISDSNYPFLINSLQIYPLPTWLPPLFFIGIVVWLAISFFAFLWACFALGQPSTVWMSRARAAYILSLLLWMAFFLADQMIFKFDLEENHMVQGGFEFLCFLALYLLP
ncbi:MAG: hypothetical protein EPO11_03280 [Gammaproteobacteria bacterium]|nr:MAG: hypothetical protein EPO11_03280 [Gammaproteobacteria bacterium]